MDFRDVLAKLAREGRLVRVKSEVDAAYEAAGIAKAYEGKQVVLFERLKGHRFPLAIGLLWNRDNLASVFDTSAEQLPFLFNNAVKTLHQNPLAPIVVEEGQAQAVHMSEVDLSRIPVPILAEKDGGPYFDNCVVIAKDPDTGVRNTSIHRLMVTGKSRMGLLMDLGRHLRDYYERAEARGKPLEITINNGVHPAYYIAAINIEATYHSLIGGKWFLVVSCGI